MSTPPLPSGLADTPETRAANALHSLSIHLLRRARAADRATGLNAERLSVLSVLTFAGPQTIGALAAIEGVSAPAISRIVSALETLGLVLRQRTDLDRRSVTVQASAKGRKLVERGRKGRIEIIAEMFEALDRTDLAILNDVARVLEKLETNTQR
ncbi:MAG TPA: MarR family transcriptional regulator [Parvularculaceae bacterium]|nr:MarR family transcriptional regulator [Parvularculaceae bacterium]